MTNCLEVPGNKELRGKLNNAKPIAG